MAAWHLDPSPQVRSICHSDGCSSPCFSFHNSPSSSQLHCSHHPSPSHHHYSHFYTSPSHRHFSPSHFHPSPLHQYHRQHSPHACGHTLCHGDAQLAVHSPYVPPSPFHTSHACHRATSVVTLHPSHSPLNQGCTDHLFNASSPPTNCYALRRPGTAPLKCPIDPLLNFPPSEDSQQQGTPKDGPEFVTGSETPLFGRIRVEEEQEKDEGMEKKEEGTEETVRLQDWYVKIVCEGEVILEGIRIGGATHMLWHSGPVVRRKHRHRVTTRSGTTYQLEGGARVERCQVGTSPMERGVAEFFRNGFPAKWKALVRKAVMKSERCADSSLQHPETGAELAELTAGAAELTAGAELTETGAGSASGPVKTEPGVLGFLSSLKRSSRGRILKPSAESLSPFLSTSTELYEYDMHGNLTGVSSPVIDLTGDDDSLSVGLWSRGKRTEEGKGRGGASSDRDISEAEVEAKPVVAGVHKSGSLKRKRKRKKSRTVIPRALRREKGSSSNVEIEWTPENIRRLKGIVYRLPAMTAGFWEKVAEQLATGHTSSECSSRYAVLREAPRKKPAAKEGVALTAHLPPAITGGGSSVVGRRQSRPARKTRVSDTAPMKNKKKTNAVAQTSRGKLSALTSKPSLRHIRTGEAVSYRVFEDSSESDIADPFSDLEQPYSDIQRLH